MKIFDKWVEEEPSHLSFGARGEYKVSLANKARGYRWARDTSEKQFEEMYKILSDAKKDLEKSIALNKESLFGYLGMISLYNLGGTNSQTKEIHDRGIENIPTSCRIRIQYLHSILPRWGGSYEEMAAYMNSIKESFQLNPKNWLLHNRIYTDIASLLLKEREYDKAIEAYTLGLKYGWSSGLLLDRAKLYVQLERYKLALKDYQYYIVFRPKSRYAQCKVAECLYQLKQHEAARDQINAVIAQDPDYDMGLYWLGRFLFDQGNYDAALEEFNYCIEVDPKYHEAYFWRARVYQEKSEFELAEKDAQKSYYLNMYIAPDIINEKALNFWKEMKQEVLRVEQEEWEKRNRQKYNKE